MKISGLRSDWRQPLLFPENLGNHGHVRNVIGELAEELTAHYVSGRRHKVQGNVIYCPDVSRREGFFESKAAGNSNQTFIYGGRLEKDRNFAMSGNRLWYVIWHHEAASKGVETTEALRSLVLQKTRKVYVVPFLVMDNICGEITPDKLNSKYGGSDSRPIYGTGYRIPLKLLESWCTDTFPGGLSPISFPVMRKETEESILQFF